jgi:LytR cell envelope-related transcriptional attenuator
MDWLELVVPSAAILAVLGMVALVVVAVVQGHRIRRLEDRLAERGDAAEEASLQRIAELQARNQVSSGLPSVRNQLRTAGAIGLTALVILAAVGGIWYLFVRGGDGGTSSASGGATTTAGRTAPAPPSPVDATLVPENVPAIPDKSVYTVTVFNATGIAGAAGDVVAPALTAAGWNVPNDGVHVANEPNAVTGLKKSVVMYTPGKRKISWGVAKDLGVKNAKPLDGYTAAQIGDADVVVVVGLDLANGVATTTTP